MLKDKVHNIFKEEYIKLDLKCNNWEEAIRGTGNILLENMLVTNEYIEETVNSVRKLGAYIVIDKGIAMPHASDYKGVKINGIAISRLENPIEFGSKNNDPVNYIFMIASKNMESHIEMLSKLSDLLINKNFINTIRNAQNRNEIIEYIDLNS